MDDKLPPLGEKEHVIAKKERAKKAAAVKAPAKPRKPRPRVIKPTVYNEALPYAKAFLNYVSEEVLRRFAALPPIDSHTVLERVGVRLNVLNYRWDKSRREQRLFIMG